MRHFTEDRPKLKELILYISEQYKSAPEYGSTVLNKVLFFCDFIAYGKFGQPITGADYIRERHGPVPRAVRLMSRSPLQELEREGALRREQRPVPNVPKPMTQVVPIALRSADLSVFSDDERSVIDDVIGTFRGWKAGPLSKYTHEFPAWRSVPLNQTIPYETIFIGPDQRLSAAETKFVQDFARRHGWHRSKP
jgi:hypothetical protein